MSGRIKVLEHSVSPSDCSFNHPQFKSTSRVARFQYFFTTSIKMSTQYAAVHESPNRPGDTRPTAQQSSQISKLKANGAVKSSSSLVVPRASELRPLEPFSQLVRHSTSQHAISAKPNSLLISLRLVIVSKFSSSISTALRVYENASRISFPCPSN